MHVTTHLHLATYTYSSTRPCTCIQWLMRLHFTAHLHPSNKYMHLHPTIQIYKSSHSHTNNHTQLLITTMFIYLCTFPALFIPCRDNLGKSALDLADRNAILLSLLQNPPTKHSKKIFPNILSKSRFGNFSISLFFSHCLSLFIFLSLCQVIILSLCLLSLDILVNIFALLWLFVCLSLSLPFPFIPISFSSSACLPI